MRFTALRILIPILVPTLLTAQGSDTLSLAGKNIVSIGIGLTGARDNNVTGNQTSTHATGEVGYLGFAHYVHPQAAVDITVAVLNTDTFEQGGSSHTNTITPILFGIHYSPEPLALSRTFRPFLSIAAGPYVHTVADANFGSTTTTTETAAGARFGAGADWFVARHFMLRAEGEYHAVSSFDHPDALTEHASGFGFGFGVGFVWGGR